MWQTFARLVSSWIWYVHIYRYKARKKHLQLKRCIHKVIDSKDTIAGRSNCVDIIFVLIRTIEVFSALLWRHNERDGVWNHQPHDCLLSRLFRHRSKKTSKLRVTGLCVGNSPVTGECPAQRASVAENISIWWHHHGYSVKQGQTGLGYHPLHVLMASTLCTLWAYTIK